jgi:type IV pilus assembly protein PilP
MKKHLLVLFGVFCALTLLSGCTNASDEPLTPKIIRKKIVANAGSQPKAATGRSSMARAAIRPNAAALPESNARPDSSQPLQAGENPVVAQRQADTRSTTPAESPGSTDNNAAQHQSSAAAPTGQVMVAQKVESEPVRPAPEVLRKPALEPKSDISAPGQSASTEHALPDDTTVAALIPPTSAENGSSEGQPPVYNPIGKIDPFEPLFKDKTDDGNVQSQRKKRVPRTPLEKIDLSQLKLVGIILAATGNKALVEEATGKGYVIEPGTYIGINSGKVIDILKDKVVIEEEDEDILGKVVVRKKEIKLPKPPGEL